MSRGRRRSVAGREQILAAARAIGERKGWGAVTIRSVARELGYTSPLLYQHFRDKQDLLTHIAVEAIALFEKRLSEKLPQDNHAALVTMVERYWKFMLRHRQLYRLANGMDGILIDRTTVGQSAQSLCKAMGDRIRQFLDENATEADGEALVDELWALLHGMAALYMDRLAPFNLGRVTDAAMKLVSGARVNERAHP
jgi:AcrR family transcriptional regulator